MPDAYAEHETLLDDGGQCSGTDETVVADRPVVVRRNAGVAALIGVAASAVAIAYLWRASQTMATLDWALCAVMAVVAGGYLVSLVDARTPLMVADDLGVRIRLGSEWRGLPWEAIGHVVVHPRRGLLRDGRLVVVPRSLARALEGLDPKGRRLVAVNQKMYGAPLAVPLGMTTRLSKADGITVADGIAALAHGRADVVELDPRTLEAAPRSGDEEGPASREGPAESTDSVTPQAPDGAQARALEPAEDPAEARGDGDPPARREVFPRVHPEHSTDAPAGTSTAVAAEASTAEPTPEPAGATVGQEDPDAEQRAPRRSILGGLGTIVSRVAKGRDHDVDRASGDAPAATPAADPAPVVPTAALRETRPGLRAEATVDLPTRGSAALSPEPAEEEPREGRELHRPGSVDLVVEPMSPGGDRVRPISTLGDPVEPLVIDDFVTEPAYDPVIGPEITAARTRLGLSVDELAERTRIRPHVIESIEVDDFAPCGGDFYARGHLRTLARILGKDPAPLLAAFDERYATAPINARRVFEAELATGMTGSMRSTAGGPSWGLLVGVVLVLVLVWGVLRLFTTTPAADDVHSPVVDGAAVVMLEKPSAVSDPA